MPQRLVLGQHEEDRAQHLSVDFVLGEIQFLEGSIALHAFTYEFQVLLAWTDIAEAQLFEPPIFVQVVLDIEEAVALAEGVVV